MNKTTVAITENQYINIITTIKSGFISEDGKQFKSNIRLATALTLECNLGMRIGDILNLTLNSIIKDGSRWRLNIIEQKTKKARKFTVPDKIYDYIKTYVLENNINSDAKMFQVGERAIQKQLQIVAKHLKIENLGSHSFRKCYATRLYENNNYNIMLVQELLQQSSPTITQRYIGISPQIIEDALNNNICLV